MLINYLLFFATAAVTLFFPSLNIQFFSAFLVFIIYKESLTSALTWAIFAGFILDLTAYSLHFGFLPLSLALTTLLLYDKKRHFFLDSLTTFPIMTTLFSSLSTLLLALFAQIPLSLNWIASDIILMPLLDGIAAFLVYTLPFIYFGTKRRRGEEYFTS